MNGKQPILLRLRSNIEQYEITVYDGCGGAIRKRIASRRACLCIRACAPCLRVVATPLVVGYSTIVYTWANAACGGVADVYLKFPADVTSSPQPALQTFTLTDANYGLPISGSLQFIGE